MTESRRETFRQPPDCQRNAKGSWGSKETKSGNPELYFLIRPGGTQHILFSMISHEGQFSFFSIEYCAPWGERGSALVPCSSRTLLPHPNYHVSLSSGPHISCVLAELCNVKGLQGTDPVIWLLLDERGKHFKQRFELWQCILLALRCLPLDTFYLVSFIWNSDLLIVRLTELGHFPQRMRNSTESERNHVSK